MLCISWCLFVFPPQVIFRSRDIGACPVTTDCILAISWCENNNNSRQLVCGGEWWAAVSFFFVRVLDDGVFFCFFSGRGRSGVKTYSNDFERGGSPYFFWRRCQNQKLEFARKHVYWRHFFAMFRILGVWRTGIFGETSVTVGSFCFVLFFFLRLLSLWFWESSCVSRTTKWFWEEPFEKKGRMTSRPIVRHGHLLSSAICHPHSAVVMCRLSFNVWSLKKTIPPRKE